MIDNVAIGPVSLVPGDNPKIDARACEAMVQLEHVPEAYELLAYHPSGRFGRLIAQYRGRWSREPLMVAFGYSMPDSATREPLEIV